MQLVVMWANFLLGAVVALLISDWLLSGVVVEGWWPYLVGGGILATGVLVVRMVAGMIGGRIGGAAVEWPGQFVVNTVVLLLVVGLVALVDVLLSGIQISGGWTFAALVLIVWLADGIIARAAANVYRDEYY